MRCPKLSLLITLLAAACWAESPAEFEPYTYYWLEQEAETVAVGDLNGDGRDDVALTVWPSAVLVFYQQEDGTLGTPVALSAPNMPLGLAIADLDGNGRLDLAVGGTGGLILLYYQQPDGTLGIPSVCSGYGNINSMALNDFNGDGLVDIAMTTGSTAAAFLFLQNGSGRFGLPLVYPVAGANARCVTALDYNSDGRRDIALLLRDQACCLIGNAAGGYDAPRYFPALWAHSLAAGDVTGDGRDDLVFSAAVNQPQALIGVYAQPAIWPSPAQLLTYASLDCAAPIALADIDGDGRIDVLAAHSGYAALTVFHQTAEGTLGPWESYEIPYSSFYQPGALAVGDLNSDGLPDVALADPWNGLVLLLHTKASDTTTPTVSAELSGALGVGGWYVSPVVITLTAEDNAGGSGVKAVYYTLDGVTWLTCSGPVTIAAEGVTWFGYCAEDLAGNKSEAQQVEIKVDTKPPTLALTPSTATLWPPKGKPVDVSVAFSAVDATSAVAALHLKVVDEYGLLQPEMDVTTSPVTVTLIASRNETDKDGRAYTLVLTGTDGAGNTASVQSTVVVPHSNSGKPNH